ncbi:hypothetical protein BKA56DRAFT_625123 [Ilyonectria sp. MPI-CAGE-AT-0026]|nr:hypothetical protein BKA56DRAFT_625123 [Ilyonectria sp. MPI-CAGE-AT-0026]
MTQTQQASVQARLLRENAASYPHYDCCSEEPIPSFLNDQAVRDILREVATGQLPEAEIKYFTDACLDNVTANDKHFLALFRWRIEIVPFRGKASVPILPHIGDHSLRGTVVSDIYRGWGPGISEDECYEKANMTFVSTVMALGTMALTEAQRRLHQTVLLVGDCMGVHIRTWKN